MDKDRTEFDKVWDEAEELAAINRALHRQLSVNADIALSDAREIRELTRQVEQLQAKVDAVLELIEDWRGTAENFDDEEIGDLYSDMADAVEAALTAPPSSSDRGRAVTGRE